MKFSNYLPSVSAWLKTVVAAPLLVGSVAANAVLVEVSYEGLIDYVYSGSTYSVGDAISGSLFIDTDLAPGDSHGSANAGNYYNGGSSNSGFVAGQATPGGRSYDQVYVEDNYYSGRDYFYAIDNEHSQNYVDHYNRAYHNSYRYVIAYDHALDFIYGDGIEQNFDLAAGDASAMFGRIYDYNYQVSNSVQTQYSHDQARFALSNLSVSSSVPEPASLALLGLGLLGIFLRR